MMAGEDIAARDSEVAPGPMMVQRGWMRLGGDVAPKQNAGIAPTHGASQTIESTLEASAFATEVACVCCETHLERSAEFDWIWSDEQGRWVPFCNCPRHHLGEFHDPAMWLFIRYDHELVDGHVVRTGPVSWPVCDACMKSWTRDGLHPEEGRVIAL